MKLISFRRTAANAGVDVGVGVMLGGDVLDVSDWVAECPLTPEALEHGRRHGNPPPKSGMLRLLQAGKPGLDALRTHVHRLRDAPRRRFDALEVLAPIPRPGKIVAVGRNYAAHAKELGTSTTEDPRLFGLFPSSVSAPGETILLPRHVQKPDFEVELAVVIGDFACELPEEQALSIVYGYTILNDISAREFQLDMPLAQTTFGKSVDGFTPMGPWLTTADDVPDPQALDISCHLNGVRVQHGNTGDMIFSIKRLISHISRYCTLEPGDVIATGTPAGSGAFQTPPFFLKSGDHLRLSIAGLGELENRIGTR